MVVVTPGWGDSMQANKAGLLEIADLFVINKADRPGAREARRDLEQMLDLSALGDWRPPVVDTTATSGGGVEDLWAEIARHRAHLVESGTLVTSAGPTAWPTSCAGCCWPAVHDASRSWPPARNSPRAVKALAAGELDPYEAADRLLVP